MLGRDTKIDLIRSVPLFADCSRQELREIAQLADEVLVPSGTLLTKEGVRGRELFVVVDGSLEVRQRDRRINQLGSGDFFGEIGLLSRAPRTASVMTTSPTHLLVITGPAFRSLLRRMPSLPLKILDALATRLADELD